MDILRFEQGTRWCRVIIFSIISSKWRYFYLPSLVHDI